MDLLLQPYYFIEFGLDDYICKPFDIYELDNLLTKTLNKNLNNYIKYNRLKLQGKKTFEACFLQKINLDKLHNLLIK